MRYKRNQYKQKKSTAPKRFARGLNFNRRKHKFNMSVMKEVMLWAGEIVLVICIAAMFVFYMGTRVSVIGPSMSGTLENGQTILVNSFIYKLISPKPNDIVVFLPNGNEKSHYYIKRVIAGPGDTVQISDGTVYVNDKPFEEEIKNTYIENALLAEEPIVVGEDEYFVLGDNRNNSEDSRYANIGNVKKEHIKGKAWFVVSPFSEFGFLK